MSEESTRSSGVQELIGRIRDDGVRAGRDEAERLVADAKREAAEIVAQARADAAEVKQKAAEEVAASHAAGLEALRLAARDTGLELEEAVINAFERQVERLVSTMTLDGDFLRTLVLVLAGHSADEYIRDQDAKIFVSKFLNDAAEDDPDVAARAHAATLAIAGNSLREGIQLIPADDVQGGARVRIDADNLEIDLTSEAISRLLLKHMLPRFRRILSGAE